MVEYTSLRENSTSILEKVPRSLWKYERMYPEDNLEEQGRYLHVLLFC